MLSTAAMPVHGPEPIHHHHRFPIHRAAEFGRVRAGHDGKSSTPAVSPLAVPAASTVPGFNIVPSPTIARSSLAAVTTISDTDVWAVGHIQPVSNADDVTLAEHFNGKSWTTVATPNPGTFGSELSGVAAVATNDVWAVGSTFATDGSGDTTSSPLIENFNGKAWSVVAAPTPSTGGGLNAVTVISADNVWAVGHAGLGRGGNLIEHFNGTAWSIVASPQLTDSFLNGVSGTSASDVWAVGSVGRFDSIEILHFDGTSWSVEPGLPEDSVLEAVVAIAADDVWAVGADIEHFNGKTWSIVPSPGGGFTGIAASSADNVYAVGGGIENWNGKSWTNVTVAVPSNTDGPLFDGVTTLSNGTAIAVGFAQPQTGFIYNQVIEQN
jgi:hypothetical protein